MSENLKDKRREDVEKCPDHGSGFVHFAHRVTLFAHGVILFAQRVTLEQIFVDSTHVVKNEVQEVIWTVQFF